MKNEHEDRSGCGGWRHQESCRTLVDLRLGAGASNSIIRSLVTYIGREQEVVLTGSQAEADMFNQHRNIDDQLPDLVPNLMGQLSLRELMAVIAASCVVVSGATGPAHIAAACGAPNVSLFDPRRNNHPTRWQPLGHGVVLRPDVPTCEKCISEACPYWDCLDRITVDTVARQVMEVTQHSAPLKVVPV